MFIIEISSTIKLQIYNTSAFSAKDVNFIFTQSSCYSICPTCTDDQCNLCGDSCSQCDQGVCNTCFDPLIFFNGTCIDSCPQGYTASSQATSNTSSSILDQSNLQCFLCNIPNCKLCSADSICTQCLDDWSLKNNSCVQCPEGTYYNKTTKQCINCSPQCLQCNQAQCLKCMNGYYILPLINIQNCYPDLKDQDVIRFIQTGQKVANDEGTEDPFLSGEEYENNDPGVQGQDLDQTGRRLQMQINEVQATRGQSQILKQDYLISIQGDISKVVSTPNSAIATQYLNQLQTLSLLFDQTSRVNLTPKKYSYQFKQLSNLEENYYDYYQDLKLMEISLSMSQSLDQDEIGSLHKIKTFNQLTYPLIDESNIANYKQFDPSWATLPVGVYNDVYQKETFRKVGCVLTAISTMLRADGIYCEIEGQKTQQYCYPPSVNQFFIENNGFQKSQSKSGVWYQNRAIYSTLNILGYQFIAAEKDFSKMLSYKNDQSGLYRIFAKVQSGDHFHTVYVKKANPQGFIVSNPGKGGGDQFIDKSVIIEANIMKKRNNYNINYYELKRLIKFIQGVPQYTVILIYQNDNNEQLYYLLREFDYNQYLKRSILEFSVVDLKNNMNQIKITEKVDQYFLKTANIYISSRFQLKNIRQKSFDSCVAYIKSLQEIRLESYCSSEGKKSICLDNFQNEENVQNYCIPQGQAYNCSQQNCDTLIQNKLNNVQSYLQQNWANEIAQLRQNGGRYCSIIYLGYKFGMDEINQITQFRNSILNQKFDDASAFLLNSTQMSKLYPSIAISILSSFIQDQYIVSNQPYQVNTEFTQCLENNDIQAQFQIENNPLQEPFDRALSYCGGNSATKQKKCFCQKQTNFVDIDKVCNQSNWNIDCCKCIISQGNPSINSNIQYKTFFDPYRVGLFQISENDWKILCNQIGEDQCDPDKNLKCAQQIYSYYNSWKYWKEIRSDSCPSTCF